MLKFRVCGLILELLLLLSEFIDKNKGFIVFSKLTDLFLLVSEIKFTSVNDTSQFYLVQYLCNV